jgi:predicted permease
VPTVRLRLKHKRLLDLLAASGLSQNNWALRVGLSRGHWSEIVNGKHPYPSPKTRLRMVEALGAPVEELFEIEVGVDPWADLDFRRAVADRYLIDTEVGQGGMGAVYLARDVRHGRLVAIKVIAAEAVSGIGLAQFQREIAIVARLHHPNILPLFDSGEAAGHPFYVTPYVRGGSLRARLMTSGRLDLLTTVRLVDGIAAGLDFAHGEGTLHCDVKPENILLHGDHSWVMDFGIARVLSSEIQEWKLRKEVNVSAGTPAYVSPEQAAGEPDLDARSDVYSLACMVFELLSGRPPFEGTTTREVVSRRFIVPPPPLRDLVPEVPLTVQSVLERAMSLPREHRQPSAGAFVGELQMAARGASRPLVALGATLSRTAAQTRRRLGLSRTGRFAGAISSTFRDLAHAWRGLRRAPGFTAAVVLTLGLALGANATMFGVVDRLLLRAPPHITRPELVHRVHVSRWIGGRLRDATPALSFPAFTDLRNRSRAFAGVAALEETSLSSGEGPDARLLRAELVTGQFFAVLGVRPFLGRFFGEDEDRLPDGIPVVVLSHGYWRTEFNADRAVVGRTMRLGGLTFEIVGVAPPGFSGTQLAQVDVWAPFSAAYSLVSGIPASEWSSQRGSQFLRVFVRVRDGLSPEVAAADARRAYQEGHADYEEYERRAIATLAPIMPGRDPSSAGREGRVATWLFGMAVIVLLIACANVANLVLARGLSRQSEIAVRRALGVGRARLLRQFATEAVLLAGLGAIAALGLAFYASRAVHAVLLTDMAWDVPVLDLRVLAFTAGSTLATMVAAAFLPLLRGTRVDLVQALHGAARGHVGGPRRLLTALLLVQTTLCTVLLVAAGLFVRSLQRARALDLGFQPAAMLDVRPTIPRDLGPAEATAFMHAATERLRALPGVRAAGLAIGAPFRTNYAMAVHAPGRDSIPSQPGGGPYYFRVSAGALEALGVRLVRGRLFSGDDDRIGAAPVVVISERMARALWPGEDPLERCLVVEGGPCAAVVGVIADLYRQSLHEDPSFMIFAPLATSSPEETPRDILVSVAGPPDRMIPLIRRELTALRSDLPYLRIQPYEALIAPQMKSWRLGATLFAVFGGLSLLMAGIGVYGVLAFNVRRRFPELGIRAALGASPGRILRMVMAGGAGAAAAGAGLGLLLALGLSARLEPLLFETSGRDGVVLVIAALSVLLFSLVAALRPGLAAARVDPLRALRAE